MGNIVLILQHCPEEHCGLLDIILKEKGWDVEICPLFKGAELPGSLRDYGLILISGSPMRLHDEKYPLWAKEEIQFIRQAFKIRQPVLGIGVGAQLMAKALGAAVRPSPHKEIGWYWINQTSQAGRDPLFSQMDPYLLVFQWHGEAIDLPSDAVCLAGNRAFPNQAFRVGAYSYGLQFHMEVTEVMVKTWLSVRSQEIKTARGTPEDILSDAAIYMKKL
jgi:GMP synthase (glutamine-hydrolysing)